MHIFQLIRGFNYGCRHYHTIPNLQSYSILDVFLFMYFQFILFIINLSTIDLWKLAFIFKDKNKLFYRSYCNFFLWKHLMKTKWLLLFMYLDVKAGWACSYAYYTWRRWRTRIASSRIRFNFIGILTITFCLNFMYNTHEFITFNVLLHNYLNKKW